MDEGCLPVSDATPAVPPLQLRSNPASVFLFIRHMTVASLHNDEAALLWSPATGGQFFFLCFSALVGFSLFFPPSEFHLLCQDLSLAVALTPPTLPPFTTCIHRTDPLGAFQMNLMGFLQCGEKLRGFLQFVWCWWNWFPIALFLNPFQLMLVLGTIMKLYSGPIDTDV